MPAERKLISDLVSFRYDPVYPVRSAKKGTNLPVRDREPQAMNPSSSRPERKSDRDPIRAILNNNTNRDYSECNKIARSRTFLSPERCYHSFFIYIPSR